MMDRAVFNKRATVTVVEREIDGPVVHPAWHALIRYCAELQHGEIEVLKIQDGLPVIAEVVRRKIKFVS
jgi:hypothetical protein